MIEWWLQWLQSSSYARPKSELKHLKLCVCAARLQVSRPNVTSLMELHWMKWWKRFGIFALIKITSSSPYRNIPQINSISQSAWGKLFGLPLKRFFKKRLTLLQWMLIRLHEHTKTSTKKTKMIFTGFKPWERWFSRSVHAASVNGSRNLLPSIEFGLLFWFSSIFHVKLPVNYQTEPLVGPKLWSTIFWG